MTRFSLTARWVLPIDEAPLEGGVVTVENGTIVDVAAHSTDARQAQDLGEVVLLPGLVNAHTHLEFSQHSVPLGTPDMTLPDWIRLVIADRKRAGRDSNESVTTGLRESLSGGVVALGNIATSALSDKSRTVPRLLQFQEVIGFSAARLESSLAELQQRLNTCHDSKPTPSSPAQGISPHAPYTVHPHLLGRLVDEAISRELPVAMHLAESPEELELLSHGTGSFRDLLEERSMWDATAISLGTTPLDYLRILARAPRAIVVHGNYLSSAEIEFLARKSIRMSVVYCPRTHEYFQHARYPLREMLSAGVRVAFGTDSRASNPDLSLFGEMRCAARLHRLSPTEVVRMATLTGAEVLGWDTMIGSIRPGKRADLIAVPCEAPDPAEAVLECEGPPTHVWVGGQPEIPAQSSM